MFRNVRLADAVNSLSQSFKRGTLLGDVKPNGMGLSAYANRRSAAVLVGMCLLPVLIALLWQRSGSREFTRTHDTQAKVEVRLAGKLFEDGLFDSKELTPRELAKLLREDVFTSRVAEAIKREKLNSDASSEVRAILLSSSFGETERALFQIKSRSSSPSGGPRLIQIYCEELDRFVRELAVAEIIDEVKAAEQLANKAEAELLTSDSELQSYKDELEADFAKPEAFRELRVLEAREREQRLALTTLDSTLDLYRAALYAQSHGELETLLSVELGGADSELKATITDLELERARLELLFPGEKEKREPVQARLDKAQEIYEIALKQQVRELYASLSQEKAALQERYIQNIAALDTAWAALLTFQQRLELRRLRRKVEMREERLRRTRRQLDEWLMKEQILYNRAGVQFLK